MKKIEKILVPIDFSEVSEKIMQLALYTAKTFKANLFVVFVAEDIFTYSGFAMTDYPTIQLEEELFENSKVRLENFLEKYRTDSSLTLQSKVLRGQVAEEILECSKTNTVDMIIMGTHGYRGMEKMLMGSVTERILKLAPCPVLTTAS